MKVACLRVEQFKFWCLSDFFKKELEFSYLAADQYLMIGNRRAGFTLLELVVSTSIVSILVLLGMANFSEFKVKASRAKLMVSTNDAFTASSVLAMELENSMLRFDSYQGSFITKNAVTNALYEDTEASEGRGPIDFELADFLPGLAVDKSIVLSMAARYNPPDPGRRESGEFEYSATVIGCDLPKSEITGDSMRYGKTTYVKHPYYRRDSLEAQMQGGQWLTYQGSGEPGEPPFIVWEDICPK